MTDFVLTAPKTQDLASDAARARVRARYRAETRFRLYGLLAIGVTAVFLVVVLTDIVMKGLPAFTQHQLMMDVKVDAEEVDPRGTGDIATIRAGDFQKLVRDAFRAQFPDVTDRAGRRQLDGILSSGASDELRRRVVADPKLIGQTVRVPVLISDDADLYFKGIGTRIDRRTGTGTATPSGETGEITIQTSANDFVGEINRVKQNVSDQARQIRREVDRIRPSLQRVQTAKADFERSLAAARAGGDRARVAALEAAIAGVTPEYDSLSATVSRLEEQAAALQARFDDKGDETLDSSVPSVLVAINGGLVRLKQLGAASVSGDVLLPLQSSAEARAGTWQIVTYVTPEANRKIGDREIAWLERLREKGLVERAFNWIFLTSGDSREPELAGIRGALIGSALTLIVTLLICLPIGVAAAIYLEEFAPKNRLTDLIEVNINNLAAVPSIVFGLLGLAVFLNFMGLPRSAPLVGGLVLALLVLPTIIIAARAALKAVPPSIKEAALGVGASHQQAIFHHVLPLAMPGVMTGTIIGMAHALGETAPLLLIGMVAFIVEPPTAFTDAGTVLPVQIFLWADLPEIAFQAKTAAAIIVLLLFLFVMNGMAIYLRRKLERRW